MQKDGKPNFWSGGTEELPLHEFEGVDFEEVLRKVFEKRRREEAKRNLQALQTVRSDQKPKS